ARVPAPSMVRGRPGESARGGAYWGPAEPLELPSSSALSVVDPEGNAVALTASIEAAFGNRQMVRGFMLNNQLTDFAWQPEEGGRPVANRVEGGKRPRSSMAPTMVFDEKGRLTLVIGSPVGPSTIDYVSPSLLHRPACTTD